MLLESVSDVMGNRADSEVTKSIRKTVEEIEPVIGAYDLILHNYGPEYVSDVIIDTNYSD